MSVSVRASSNCSACGRSHAAGAPCAAAGDTSASTLEASPREPAPIAGRYVLGRPLGRGATKSVYVAHDLRLGRDVALAVMNVGSVAERRRIADEARLIARLGEHPHVITVHDAGEDDGLAYLVARLMNGRTLADAIASAPGGRLDVPSALRAAREVALALDHAHQHGVIHRDVKPANIWFDEHGAAVLGDFGVAYAGKPELTRRVIGTVAYLSPEQARADPVDARSDLYALGATLYHALTGRPPFVGDMAAVLAQHQHARPVPPSAHAASIPPELERLVTRLLAKDPSERPQAAAEVAAALAEVAPREGDRGEALVGRESERRQLGAALDASLRGAGRIVALAGEAGIGKTTLARELAREAEGRGATVAWGRCVEDAGAPGYRPWREALRDVESTTGHTAPAALAPLLAAGATPGDAPRDADAARSALFGAVSAYLGRASEIRPLLVILEDLHWADRSSLLLLEHVSQALSQSPMLLCISYRAAAAGRSGALRDAIATLARTPDYNELAVCGLGPADVARLVSIIGAAATPGLAAAVHHHTGGNPFFVAEVARALTGAAQGADAVEVLPASVRALVGRRVAELPRRTREVLEAAAVAGTHFTLDVAARAAGVAPGAALDALEEAEAASLTTTWTQGRRHGFSHAIVRAAVYAEMPERRRRELHAAVAAALARRLDADPAEIAHHHLEAARRGGDPQPALQRSMEAAARAEAQFAHAEAASLYEGAIEALELGAETPPQARRELALRAGRAHTSAGDLDRGRERFRQAANRAAGDGAPEDFARAALGFAEWADYGFVDVEAIRLLEQALALLPKEDGALRALALGRLAVRLDASAEQMRREQLIDEAVAMARRLCDDAALTTLLPLSLLVNWRPERGARRRDEAAASVELARQAGDAQMALWARIIRFVDAFGAGDLAAADAELATYHRTVAQLRQPYYAWYGKVLEATRSVFGGALDAGRRLVDDAATMISVHDADSDHERAVQSVMLARARGAPHEADLEAVQRLAARYPEMALWQSLAGGLEAELGLEGKAAVRLRLLAHDGFCAAGSGPDGVATLGLLAELVVRIGDVEMARGLHDRLAASAGRNLLTERAWAAWGAVDRTLGALAAAADSTAEAREHFGRAAGLNQQWRTPVWWAHTIADWAAWLPDAPPRRQDVVRAREAALECGLPGLERRLAAELDARVSPDAWSRR